MGQLFQDLRYGVRTLFASPGFTIVAILSLGLGIGANTTIYSVLNELVLNDVTANARDRLLRIGEWGVAYPTYRDLAESGVFKELAVYTVYDWNWRQGKRARLRNDDQRQFVRDAGPGSGDGPHL